MSTYSDGATTVLLAGVGGQGTILAADVLAKVAIKAGLEVKLSEIHGMAQRGGSVSTIVRFGQHVNSMVCDEGSADFVLSFETTEALRALPFVAREGVFLVNDEQIKPLSVLSGRAGMPKHALERLKREGAILVPASKLAREAGNPKCANVVLLGALADTLPFDVELWKDVIAHKVPAHTVEVNLKAFDLGRACVESASHK